jgi:hypothetical protein
MGTMAATAQDAAQSAAAAAALPADAVPAVAVGGLSAHSLDVSGVTASVAVPLTAAYALADSPLPHGWAEASGAVEWPYYCPDVNSTLYNWVCRGPLAPPATTSPAAAMAAVQVRSVAAATGSDSAGPAQSLSSSLSGGTSEAAAATSTSPSRPSAADGSGEVLLLPQGWDVARDAAGRPCYYQVTYVRLAPAPQSASASVPAQLPPSAVVTLRQMPVAAQAPEAHPPAAPPLATGQAQAVPPQEATVMSAPSHAPPFAHMPPEPRPPCLQEIDPLISAFRSEDVEAVRPLLQFLYDRDVLQVSDEKPLDRCTKLRAIIFGEGNLWEALKPIDRLRAIYHSPSDRRFDHIPSDVQSWERAMSCELAHWRSPSHYVWFLQRGTRPLQRSQPSRLSYLHAPIVLISYIRQLFGRGPEMIDMMEWMRRSASCEVLDGHIFTCRIDSCLLLEILLTSLTSIIRLAWYEIDDATLKCYGPGLVCGFDVSRGFEEEGKFRYGDEDIPDPKSDSEFGTLTNDRHAMVLVGVCVSPETRQRVFLLQNWWRRKQFVECSQGYLEACGARAIFVMDGSGISANIPYMDCIYAEAADIDRGEPWGIED